jgi:cystine transport system substrate-binding protein
MKFALLGRQALMGVMAVALVAGMSVKTFAAENLLNKVKERGTLLVGLEGTYPPFSFQGDDGKLTGFEVEFAEELAKHLGVKASLKPTKWDGMLASLDSKRIDVVINQVTISDERKKKYDFSTPYTVSGIQALVKKGNEGTIKTAADLKGRKSVSVWEPTTKSGCARTFRAWISAPMMMTRRNTRICAWAVSTPFWLTAWPRWIW